MTTTIHMIRTIPIIVIIHTIAVTIPIHPLVVTEPIITSTIMSLITTLSPTMVVAKVLTSLQLSSPVSSSGSLSLRSASEPRKRELKI